MNLDWISGLEIIIFARQENEKDKSWQMWLMQYQNMSRETFKPFSEFWAESQMPAKSQKSQKEILEKAKQIRKSMGK